MVLQEGCSSHAAVLWGCCSFAACPAPLLSIPTLLGAAMSAEPGASGPIAGQGDEVHKVAPASPSELQRLSSAPVC